MIEIATDREVLMEQNPKLVARSQRYYDEDMEYHNYFGHVLSVWEEARRLALYCIQNGLFVNIPVLDVAVNLHDANLHKQLIKRYKTAERWAGAIGRREALGLGFSVTDAEAVRTAILPTAYKVKPTTVEGAITKRADLGNVGGSYIGFIGNSIRYLEKQSADPGFKKHLKHLKNGLVMDVNTCEGTLEI